MEITLNEPVFDETNGFYSSTVNSENDRIKIRTPGMRYLGGGDGLIYLEFLPNNNELYNIIKSIDEKILKQIVSNGEKWFGKALSLETVERLLVPSVNLPVDLVSYPYVIFETEEDLEVVDKTGIKSDLFELKPDYEISVTFILDRVIFFHNKFEILYLVEKIEILNYVCQAKRCVVDDDDDSETDFVNSVTL